MPLGDQKIHRKLITQALYFPSFPLDLVALPYSKSTTKIN
jgi:hypothetical protein